MPRPSRRRLLGALGTGLAAAVAGCIAGTPPGNDESPNATATTTTRTTTTTTEDPAFWQHASDEVSYDHEVSVENADDAAHTVEVRIEDVTNDSVEIVHEDTYEVPAAGETSTEVTAFQFSTLDDQEHERTFSVRARFSDGDWTSESIEMDACHGDVIVTVTGDGELEIIYSIC